MNNGNKSKFSLVGPTKVPGLSYATLYENNNGQKKVTGSVYKGSGEFRKLNPTPEATINATGRSEKEAIENAKAKVKEVLSLIED